MFKINAGLNIISKRVVLDVCGFASNHLINFPETSVTRIKLLESNLM